MNEPQNPQQIIKGMIQERVTKAWGYDKLADDIAAAMKAYYEAEIANLKEQVEAWTKASEHNLALYNETHGKFEELLAALEKPAPDEEQVREKITEAGEILICAYQSRVDNQIEPEEFQLFVYDFPARILSLVGSRQEGWVKLADDQTPPEYDHRLGRNSGYGVQQDMIDAGFRKVILSP